MEENNTNEEQVIKEPEKKHICFENHCWKMCLGMVAAAFLGGFLAVYFIADQYMQRQFYKYEPKPMQQDYYDITEPVQINQLDELRKVFDLINSKNLQKFQEYRDEWEKDFDDDFDRELDKHFKKLGKKPFEMTHFMTNEAKIKTDIDENHYNIIVGLKPFQNDESKINYNISNKKLTVFGKSEIKEKGRSESIEFSHDFLLPENADTMNISKKKDGNKLVISVPLKR